MKHLNSTPTKGTINSRCTHIASLWKLLTVAVASVCAVAAAGAVVLVAIVADVSHLAEYLRLYWNFAVPEYNAYRISYIITITIDRTLSYYY
jgi:hypothetical protein